VSLGNDVVDLADSETRDLHPRFDERVFDPRERALLSDCPSPHVLRWALWAAKESAYKALKRLDPQTVFSPRRFAVDLSTLPARDGVATGRVVHGNQALDLDVRVDGPCVHAVCRRTRSWDARLQWRVAPAGSDPSAEVRRLASTDIASALGLDPDGIQIVRRPPVALRRGRPLVADLSLSHHGSFVALAFASPAGASRKPVASRSLRTIPLTAEVEPGQAETDSKLGPRQSRGEPSHSQAEIDAVYLPRRYDEPRFLRLEAAELHRDMPFPFRQIAETEEPLVIGDRCALVLRASRVHPRRGQRLAEKVENASFDPPWRRCSRKRRHEEQQGEAP
jgi:hypothetical protein